MKKKILIVIDVQNDFITGALRNEEAIKTLPNIVNLINAEKFDQTFVTMDTHLDDKYFSTLEGKKLPVKHCIKGTDGWEMPNSVIDALKNQNVVQIFEKPTFGSVWMANFIHSIVMNDYNNMHEYEFTIVGYCSDICVISNALMLRANFPDNKIVVRKDCVAGVTPESNDAALLTMAMCQIDVI